MVGILDLLLIYKQFAYICQYVVATIADPEGDGRGSHKDNGDSQKNTKEGDRLPNYALVSSPFILPFPPINALP